MDSFRHLSCSYVGLIKNIFKTKTVVKRSGCWFAFSTAVRKRHLFFGCKLTASLTLWDPILWWKSNNQAGVNNKLDDFDICCVRSDTSVIVTNKVLKLVSHTYKVTKLEFSRGCLVLLMYYVKVLHNF